MACPSALPRRLGPVVKGILRPGERTGLRTEPTASTGDAPVRAIFQSPFQIAPPGRSFYVRPEAFSEYLRPGLDRVAPLEFQLERLQEGEGSRRRPNPKGLLSSVRLHPARQQPIGKGIPSVESMWPPLSRALLLQAQLRVEEVLKNFQVQRTDGSGRQSLYAKLMDPGLPLGLQQRHRVLQVLGEYWASLQDHRDFDLKASDENWNHIGHEVAQVLDAGRAAGLSATALEDALLASIFSDSVKFQSTLLVHNVHGAIAADLVLTRRRDPDLNEARIAGIVQATKEHQIGVPQLFAKLVPLFIGFTEGVFPGQDPAAHFREEQVLALARIQEKLSQPLSPEHTAIDPQTGARAIVFDPVERDLLDRVGIGEWPVPDPKTPWFEAAMTVLYADSVQYGMPDGVGKIMLLSGPGTNFHDDTVLHSAFACGTSFIGSKGLIPEAMLPLYEGAARRTQAIIETVVGQVDRELAQGGVILEATQLARVVESYGVDLAAFQVEQLEGHRVRVRHPGAEGVAVPYFHVPLDYAVGAQGPSGEQRLQHDYAKLIRSRVGDALRSAADWYHDPA